MTRAVSLALIPVICAASALPVNVVVTEADGDATIEGQFLDLSGWRRE